MPSAKQTTVRIPKSSIVSKRSPNRGTGAGGANTNVTGLRFEALTDLSTHYSAPAPNDLVAAPGDDYAVGGKCGRLVAFNRDRESRPGGATGFIAAPKASMFKTLDSFMSRDVAHVHGCKQPDECYIRYSDRVIFIIEKKNQTGPGSACEKLLTGFMKRHHYGRLFPSHHVVYVYCLSNWFRENCVGELALLDEFNIPYYFGEKATYKEEVVDFMIKYRPASAPTPEEAAAPPQPETPDKVMNPVSGRYIKATGNVARRLRKEGVLPKLAPVKRPPPGKVVNPRTGRFIQAGGATAKRLRREGVL